MIVEMSDRAVADYLALVEHITEFSTRGALSFIDAFESTLLALREFPRLGHARTDPEQRVLHFARLYHIEYELHPNRLIIRRVKDGRRHAD